MKLTAAERFSRSEIAELLARYEGLHILPSIGTTTSIVGTIAFRAEGRATPLIEDSYEVRIEVPENVPERMALVWETAGRIPATFHRLDCWRSPKPDHLCSMKIDQGRTDGRARRQ
jgi:hypothetical protein